LYTSDLIYVRTNEELETAIKRLSGSPFVALDTEFLRERTYYPKFCLLQIAHDDYCAVIDVLALPSLAPVLDFLNDRARVKVLHAAHQDLEVLALARGALVGQTVAPLVGPFVDTQVAAAFLDMPINIGYADLVQRRLNHVLPKGQARTDWSQRPLSDEQLAYAADDVIYLVKLYHNLKDELDRTMRWGWIAEDALELEQARFYVTEPSEAWQRLKGLDQLEPLERAAAKALAEWRERRAIFSDRPRNWILADDALRQLAEKLPTTIEDLTAIAELPRGLIEKRGPELLTLIAQSRVNSANEPPARVTRATRLQQKQILMLMDFIRGQSAHLHVSAERLATRREIEALVFSGRIGAFGRGWRHESFGKRLIELSQHATRHPEGHRSERIVG
jgi:ribonuclease D